MIGPSGRGVAVVLFSSMASTISLSGCNMIAVRRAGRHGGRPQVLPQVLGNIGSEQVQAPMSLRSFVGECYLTVMCRWLHRSLGSPLVDRFIYGPDWFPVAVDREAVRAGCRMRLDLHELVSRLIYFLGSHEPAETALIERILGPDWVVIDVGAQIGFYTLLVAGRLDPGRGRVYSVEANPSTYERLRDHVTTNGLYHVRVINLAIGETSGMIDLYPGPSYNTGLSSVLNRGCGVGPVTVRQVTLDELVLKQGLQRCDLIKIDVEGAEAAVINGGMETLRRFRPRLLVEFNASMLNRAGSSPSDLAGTLQGLGYALYDPRCTDEPLTLDRVRSTEFMNVYAECSA